MELVRTAEARKSSRILVVGMNLDISGEEQQAQADVFDRAFIGWDLTNKQVREMFRGLIDQ